MVEWYYYFQNTSSWQLQLTFMPLIRPLTVYLLTFYYYNPFFFYLQYVTVHSDSFIVAFCFLYTQHPYSILQFSSTFSFPYSFDNVYVSNLWFSYCSDLAIVRGYTQFSGIKNFMTVFIEIQTRLQMQKNYQTFY